MCFLYFEKAFVPEYVARLAVEVKEAIAAADRCGLRIKTVYIGGGTPSILEPELLEVLMSSLAEALGGREIEEFTFEAGRPDTITAEKLAIAKKYGANRISVNPQTLSAEVLSGIGRSHTVEDFYRAYSTAREVGIECINTDTGYAVGNYDLACSGVYSGYIYIIAVIIQPQGGNSVLAKYSVCI